MSCSPRRACRRRWRSPCPPTRPSSSPRSPPNSGRGTTTADLVLAWETDDPARLRALLTAVGFRVGPDGPFRIRGLGLEAVQVRGPGRLRAAEPRGEGDAPRRGAAAGRGDPGRPRLLAVAIATVDLERAAPAVGGLRARLPDDDLLGARVAAAGRSPLLLAEPRAEGRLAAALARHGEGPTALYVAVAPAVLRDVGAVLARRGERLLVGGGPFGSQALAPVERRWGPFLLLVGDAAAGDGPPTAGASATIAP